MHLFYQNLHHIYVEIYFIIMEFIMEIMFYYYSLKQFYIIDILQYHFVQQLFFEKCVYLALFYFFFKDKFL